VKKISALILVSVFVSAAAFADGANRPQGAPNANPERTPNPTLQADREKLREDRQALRADREKLHADHDKLKQDREQKRADRRAKHEKRVQQREENRDRRPSGKAGPQGVPK